MRLCLALGFGDISWLAARASLLCTWWWGRSMIGCACSTALNLVLGTKYDWLRVQHCPELGDGDGVWLVACAALPWTWWRGRSMIGCACSTALNFGDGDGVYMGPHFTLLLSINVLCSNVTYIYPVSCLVEINFFKLFMIGCPCSISLNLVMGTEYDGCMYSGALHLVMGTEYNWLRVQHCHALGDGDGV